MITNKETKDAMVEETNKAIKKFVRKRKILDGISLGLIFLSFFVVGLLFYDVVLDIDDENLLFGQWEREDAKNFIKIRVDDLAIDYNITRIINHELGHEIYYRLHGSQNPEKESEDFAFSCSVDIRKCVELLNEK